MPGTEWLRGGASKRGRRVLAERPHTPLLSRISEHQKEKRKEETEMKIYTVTAIVLMLASAPVRPAFAQFPSTLGSGPAEQIEHSMTQPMPLPQAPAPPPPPSVWVPDRAVPDTVYGGTSVVPGHWDNRLPGGSYYSPPLTACNPSSGACSTAPARVYPSPAMGIVP
jgi:hypothetical protein